MTYRELVTPEEIQEALKLVDAWREPLIPRRQYEIAVKHEMEKDYNDVPPFKAFREIVDYVRYLLTQQNPLIKEHNYNILEVGASSGYYGELLKRWGFNWDYTALDYNPQFGELIKELWPYIKFIEGDALNLPFSDNSFNIVVSGCCMLHLANYKQAMSEAARVSRRYVIFHRHPILWDTYTRFFLKEAYEVPCFEIWFGAKEFKDDLKKNNLKILKTSAVFERDTEYGKYGHYTILTEKI